MPGDEVFGATHRRIRRIRDGEGRGNAAPKPANISFEQAAAVPVAAITALQGLRAGGFGAGRMC